VRTATPAAALVAVLVVGCAAHTPRVTGTVAYRERMALPPNATVRVLLEDVSVADAPATVVAEQIIRPEREVPVPFELRPERGAIDPRRRYAVRAEIADADGRLRWTTTEAYPAVTQGAPGEIDVVVHPAPRASATLVYDCDSGTFTVQIEGDMAWLLLPSRTVALPHVPSASGAKYADRGIVFWSRGDEAMLDVGRTAYRECRLNRAQAVWENARLRGVEFRAVGNEPGWQLEIADEREILFVTDYGETRISAPVPAPVVDDADARTTYHVTTAARDLQVVIEDRPCQDDMSGESFPSAVTVELDGRTHRGCGRRLR
jgi:putative lipoprotein